MKIFASKLSFITTAMFFAISTQAAVKLEVWDCNAGRGSALKAPTHLTAELAVSLATKAATEANYNLANFNTSSICFESSPKYRKWVVFYESIKDPRPGFDFTVEVQDDTSKTKIFPGM